MSENSEFNGFLSIEEKRKLASRKGQKLISTKPLLIQQARNIVLEHQRNVDHSGDRIPAKLETKIGSNMEPIDGFYFSYENNELQALLTDPKMKGVYAAIAKYPGTDAGYTIVLYGVTKKDGNDLTLHLVDDEIYDFCDPCPPVCAVAIEK